MRELKACTVCFNTDGRLNKLHGKLERQFSIVSALKAQERAGFPQYLCIECTGFVQKYVDFQEKCKRAHFALKEIVTKDIEITVEHLKCLDCKVINNMPTLSFIYDAFEVPVEDIKGYDNGSAPVQKSDVFNVNIVKLEDQNDIEVELLKATADAADLEDGEYFFDNDDLDSENNDNIEEKINKLLTTRSTRNKKGKYHKKDYAKLIPLTDKEIIAVKAVNTNFSKQPGPYYCEKCNKGYFNEERYNIHCRMHDRHVSGNFHCKYCDFYYKTDFLLTTHMNDKHKYKYVCKKCPEVSYTRPAAKKHYMKTHTAKPKEKPQKKKPKKKTKEVKLHHVRNLDKYPPDFLKYSPLTQEQQYAKVDERKTSRNYLEAVLKCDLCYKGFREIDTHTKHMTKHNPELSGNIQCDMCKLYFPDTRKLYRHMHRLHLFQYSCQECNYVCYGRGQAFLHYKWHKNITYKCSHCNKEFKRASTHLTHVRLKHPSTFICSLCGHSYISETGLYCHKRLSHTAEEIERSDSIEVNTADPYYCAECKVQFVTPEAFTTHLNTSNKHAAVNIPKPRKRKRLARAPGRPASGRLGHSEIINTGVPTASHCPVCGKFLSNDVQARKHYESEHPGTEMLKRYMCDQCGHTTRQYANLLVHMRTHTMEKPYECPYCDRKFSMPSNRDRHLVVHTKEKKFQCQHCNRRFTQSSAVKLHIQTVHLKIPYAPWDKKARKRRKELENSTPSTAVPTTLIPIQQPKILLDPQGDYINAYVTYNDE